MNQRSNDNIICYSIPSNVIKNITCIYNRINLIYDNCIYSFTVSD